MTFIKVLVATVAAGALAQPAYAQPQRPFASVHEVLESAVASKAVPMVGVVIRQSGKIVFRDAVGLAGEGATRPFSTDTLLRIQSLTKPIVAVGILMLVEKGKIRLDDPASNYVPVLAKLNVRTARPSEPGSKAIYDLAPAQRQITIRDLLTHTSGLQSINQPNDFLALPVKGETLESWTAKLEGFPLDFQPGARWAYSNVVGFDVLARVIEVASGQRIDRYLQENIFDPLDMNDTGFGMGTRPDKVSRVISIPDFSTNERATGVTYFSGGAGLWSTVDDYSEFAQMLADGGAYNGKRLLTAKSVSLMSSNQVGDKFPGLNGRGKAPGVGFGLSVAVVGDAGKAGLAVPNGSFGWDGVGQTRFWVSPAQHRVLVMHAPSAPVQIKIEQAVDAAAR